MGSKYKTIAILPLRSGSKSIPLKNVKLINKKPLAMWSIEAACSSKCIDKVVVASDDKVIDEPLKHYMESFQIEGFDKVEFYRRSKESATDTASSEMVMMEVLNHYHAEHYFMLQATSPLTTSAEIDEAYSLFISEHYDSLLTAVRQKRFIWKMKDDGFVPQNYDPQNRPMRQAFSGFLVENGAFYLGKVKKLFETESRLSGKIGIYEMPEDTYFEIDEIEDWIIVEELLQKRKIKNNHISFNNIKALVMDCDGVLTDTKMYYNHTGEEMKVFSTRDGMGLGQLKKHGFKLGIISGEKNGIVESRAKKLGIEQLYLGSNEKDRDIKHFASVNNIELEQIAYIGDDINDLTVIDLVGISFAPRDAIKVVKDKVNVVLENCGGNGAVREVCDIILGSSK